MLTKMSKMIEAGQAIADQNHPTAAGVLFYEPQIDTVEDLLRLPAKGRALCWQIDSLARRLLGHLKPVEMAAMLEFGAWPDEDWIIWYRPSRSLGAMRLLGGRIAVEGTRRLIVSPAGLFGRERLQEVLKAPDAGGMMADDLPELLTRLHMRCVAAKLPLPNQWCSPGDFATAALRHWKIEPIADPGKDMLDMAQVYFGGRIEVTAHGDVPGPLYEYDLNSAYGAAMVEMPAPGGEWVGIDTEGDAEPARDGKTLPFSLSQCRWRMPPSRQCRLGPLPIRKADGAIHFPYRGTGVYWERELRAAELFGAIVKREKSWAYIPPSTKPSDPAMWKMVDFLYWARRDIGSMAKPILPACYGKFMQHRGSRKSRRHFVNPHNAFDIQRISIEDIAIATLNTFLRMFVAYVVSLIVAVPLALAIASTPGVQRLLLPIADILQSVPVLAFFPVVVVFFTAFNAFELAAIFVIFVSMVWNIVFPVIGGLQTIPDDVKSAAIVFDIRGVRKFWYVTLPAIVPFVITGSLLAWAQGWTIVIVAEVLHTYIPHGTPSQDRPRAWEPVG